MRRISILLLLTLPFLSACSDASSIDTIAKIKEKAAFVAECKKVGGMVRRDWTASEYWTGRSHYICELSSKGVE